MHRAHVVATVTERALQAFLTVRPAVKVNGGLLVTGATVDRIEVELVVLADLVRGEGRVALHAGDRGMDAGDAVLRSSTGGLDLVMTEHADGVRDRFLYWFHRVLDENAAENPA